MKPMDDIFLIQKVQIDRQPVSKSMHQPVTFHHCEVGKNGTEANASGVVQAGKKGRKLNWLG